MLGTTGASGGVGGPVIRYLTYRYPESPNMFAKTARIVPVGDWTVTPTDATVPIAYTNARITIEFASPQWTFTPDQDPGFLNSLSQDLTENAAMLWATQEIDYGSEAVQIPQASMVWADDLTPTSTPVAAKYTTCTMTITFERFPYMPVGILRTYQDCLNSQTFLGCPTGMVYFVGAKTRREYSSDGTISQRLSLVFKQRQQSWNKFLKAPGNWQYLQTPGGALTYTTKDFKNLIRFIPG
jgi:hypothetical protein